MKRHVGGTFHRQLHGSKWSRLRQMLQAEGQGQVKRVQAKDHGPVPITTLGVSLNHISISCPSAKGFRGGHSSCPPPNEVK